ncbi:MaoC family dehydratase [Chitinasiproducens palmae]|uniref:Acyl dehydratase n=1 Tax=Chitinasiproducens palmae TaxID=1770053 RepID=A0A1H2PNU8_9BURK|nr:MaoC/PaaZ C-terminal domain-containing protein [Chitinasiproducens palmae]SDV48390.1 Acyl dehydratase [Chitinasiproducens palmae]
MSRIVTIGDTFSHELRFTADQIQRFAELTGDSLPLHRDPSYARDHRFPGLVVSAAHLSAHLLSAIGNHFNAFAHSLNTQLDIRFERAILANDTLVLDWRVTDAFWKDKPGGDVTTLALAVHNQRELSVASGTATLLVMPKSADLSSAAGAP